MKYYFRILVSSVAAFGVLVAGCSKSKDSTSKSPGGASGALLSSDQPALLKVKWIVGKKYVEQMTMTQDQEMKAGKPPQTIPQVTTISQDYRVSCIKETAGGGWELELEFAAYKVSVQRAGQAVIDFDSARPASEDRANPLAGTLRKVVGLKLTYQVDADGKVLSVAGIDEFLAKLGSGGNPQASMILTSMMSSDQLKQYLDFGRMLPNKELKPADKWAINLQTPMGVVGEITMGADCTFAGWQQNSGHKCARIDSTGTLSSKAAGQARGYLGSNRQWHAFGADVVRSRTGNSRRKHRKTGYGPQNRCDGTTNFKQGHADHLDETGGGCGFGEIVPALGNVCHWYLTGDRPLFGVCAVFGGIKAHKTGGEGALRVCKEPFFDLNIARSPTSIYERPVGIQNHL